MLSSTQGSLGIGANLNRWSAEDFSTAKRLIAAYHLVQRTIVRGDLFRLISTRLGSEFSSTETVSNDKNQAVKLFNPMRGKPTPKRSIAPRIRNATMVTTLIIANQYSTEPKSSILNVLISARMTEKPAIQIHAGACGSQNLQ